MERSVAIVRRWINGSRTASTATFLFENIVATLRPRQIRAPHRPAEPHSHFLAAMVRVKDEGRFLPEWLSYHYNLGVEQFYVYDNGSTDGTFDLIAPFIDAGLVCYESWPQRPISPAAELHFLNKYGAINQWVAFLDADEFVCEREPGQLLSTLSSNSNLPAVAINFRYFGSSNHEALPDGLVVENFTLADSTLDRHVKVIAQPTQIRRYRNAHNHFYHGGRLARTTTGRRAFASFAYEDGVTNADLVLNHYVYRSRADYERKVWRGFAERRGEQDQARRVSKIESEFGRHNEEPQKPSADAIVRTRGTLRRMGYTSLFAGEA